MDDLLGLRFRLNMHRITALVNLLHSSAALKPTAILQSDGERADILRSIVVFLHAAFEDLLRTTARQRVGDAPAEVLKTIPLVGTTKLGRAEKFTLGSLATHRGKTVDHLIRESVEDYLSRESFGSCSDVEEILKQMGLDTIPFKFFYPPLDQMMQRRHRIVHEADLSEAGTVLKPWSVVDDWQLVMWLLTVQTFYYRLRISVNLTSVAEHTEYESLRAVMISWVDYGKELLALPKVPPELQMEALHKITNLLESMASRLKGSALEPAPNPD